MADSKLTPCIACMMGEAKFCTTASVMVDSRKNAKHHHTTGSRRKATSLPLGASAARRTTSVFRCARLATSTARMHAYISAAAR